MPDAEPGSTDGGRPLVWRIPPWQPAGLVLLATVLIALVLYAHFSLGATVAMGAVALAALASAFFAARLLLVADDDGIWIRRALSQQHVEWDDVTSAELVHVRGTTFTVSITRRDGSGVNVPPSLLLPTLPTGVRKVRSIVHTAALELDGLARQHRA